MLRGRGALREVRGELRAREEQMFRRRRGRREMARRGAAARGAWRACRKGGARAQVSAARGASGARDSVREKTQKQKKKQQSPADPRRGETAKTACPRVQRRARRGEAAQRGEVFRAAGTPAVQEENVRQASRWQCARRKTTTKRCLEAVRESVV